MSTLSRCSVLVGLAFLPLLGVGCTGVIDPDNPSTPGDPSDPGNPDRDGSGIPGVVLPPTGEVISPLRRLSRRQYDNTVRALFAAHLESLPVEDSLTDEFTPEAIDTGGFVDSSRTTSTLDAENYLEAAEDLAARAVSRVYNELLPCDPATTGESECVRRFIEDFGRDAYRRPLEVAEIDALTDLYETGRVELASDFPNAVRLVITAMLQSPYFLYQVERGLPGTESADGSVALGPYEIASRLSYFLWDSMPDDELFAAAETGALSSPEGIGRQTERMLAMPEARAMITTFHRRWLELDQLEHATKDADAYPRWNEALRASMVNETDTFADYVIREGDGRLETLLTGAFSFVDAPLADLYGVAPPGVDWGRVELDPAERAGLLTQPAVLSAMASAIDGSPIRRGLLIRERFLCQTLPPPPDGIPQPPPRDPAQTVREHLAAHTEDPVCQSCHTLIDPIGFGFEHYDAIGQFQADLNGTPLDASGALNRTLDADGAFEGVPELAHRLAQSEEVHRCVMARWFRFALGRYEGAPDAASFDGVLESFAASDQDIRELIDAITRSPSFTRRSIHAGTETADE